MTNGQGGHSRDRRVFLGATAALLGLPNISSAQQKSPELGGHERERSYSKRSVCDVIKTEGSAPTATIVGRPLRAAPRLAALANGVSDHAMDFDLSIWPASRLPRSSRPSFR